MKLLEEYIKLLGGYTPVKQVAEPLEIIGVVATVTPEDKIRMEQDFSRNCELLQAEDCQALSVMKNIVAGGPCLCKKIKK